MGNQVPNNNPNQENNIQQASNLPTNNTEDNAPILSSDQMIKQREYFLNLAAQQKQLEEENDKSKNQDSVKMDIDDSIQKKIPEFKPVEVKVQPKPVVAEPKPQVQVQTQPQAQPKNIDLEHVTIEKTFRITLDKTKADKAKYLEAYAASLSENGKELKFRVTDMDNLIITMIEEEKTNIISYLFVTYHRAYELIEIKYKEMLKEKFSDTLRLLASYLSLIVTSPENFELNIPMDSIIKALDFYLNDTAEGEAINLLKNVYIANEDNEEGLKQFFDIFINVINTKSIKSFMDNKGCVSILINVY